MSREILECIQRRVDTGVLAAGAGLQDHSIGGAKKRKYTKKAKTVMPEPDASPVSDAEGGKKTKKRAKRTKKGGASALDVPIASVGGETDGGSKGGKKAPTAWNLEVMKVKADKGCTFAEALKLASAARKAKK